MSCAKTFADVGEILVKYRDLSIPDLITSTVKKPLAEIADRQNYEDHDYGKARRGR